MTNELHRRGLLASASLAALSPHLLGAITPGATTSLPIKVGQIGTGHSHASGKWETFNRFPDLFEVVGIAEPNETERKRWENRGPFRQANWISEAELLAKATLVIVETDVVDLVSTAKRAVAAGKHLHLDKPGGTNLADFAELIEQAEQRKRIIQMGYMFRYNPAFSFLFDAVRKGLIGKIREINGAIGKKAGAEMRTELAVYPGGGMFELGCHLVDAVVTTLGPPAKVHAFNRYSRDDGFADNQLAVFEFAEATATIRCNHVDPFGGPRRQFSVIGDAGSIEIRPLEPPNLTLMVDRDRDKYKKGTHRIEFPRAGRYDGDFRDLAAVLSGQKEFTWDYSHDLAVQKAVLEASGMQANA